MHKISVNGKICTSDDPVLPPNNRGYRYGDSIFETLRVRSGSISLRSLHFERLFSSMQLLGYLTGPHFTAEKLEQEVLQLCRINNCLDDARVRLSVSRGSGGLYDCDEQLFYIIECWELKGSFLEMNENGLIIDVCPGVVKHHDRFSHLKSGNFLPYVMGAAYARSQKLNDCILLNASGRVADATIANIFVFLDGKYITPPLDEGCVAGVMRRHLLHQMAELNMPVIEKSLTMDEVEASSAVFLTNAIHGVRWVRSFRHRTFNREIPLDIYNQFVKTIH